ncbi:hypothetical protein D0T84_01970 [Dysgonomonas sp. 521]|uniref:hypothetical protein n=1 Tax=Dysgonomonas sp. 521 TaxID=2302932 RepID=UPI0013D45D9F|nr:hypothetical protein [Dysgonomonas sp. 521]NDV93684.1 hypothetical protein [Dysgonomonas sp. 521]
MEKLFHILFALVVVSAFSSCGSDDEKERKYFNGDCRQTISLESGVAGNTVITSPVTSKLDDMLQYATGYGYPVVSGEFHENGENTAVKVIGLPDGVVLKNFSMEINGLKKDFGNIDITYANLYTGNGSYFKKVFESMVNSNRRELKTSVTFTPTERITSDTKVEIVFSGRFSYWQKK